MPGATGQPTADDLAEMIEANIKQAQRNINEADANSLVIQANLDLIKSARWRWVRNGRLMNHNRALLADNRELLRQNNLLIAENGALLVLHRAQTP